MVTTLPERVHVTEVGPRDGLQNEKTQLATADKARLVRALVAAGVTEFELTSFVSPKAVPALADAADLVHELQDVQGVHWSALVPNLHGARRALEAGVDSIVLVVSASETHNRKNVNRGIDESLRDFAVIARELEGSNMALRAGIATSFGCPFEGDVDVRSVGRIARFCADIGVRYVSLGDTTGMATPPLVVDRVTYLRDNIPELSPTLHFHNTRGIGLANVMQGLQLGITRYESSIGGLGGCPFAPRATGNIATEDLVYLLTEMGIETGIDLDRLIDAAQLATRLMGRPLPGQVSKAGPRLLTSDAATVRTARG